MAKELTVHIIEKTRKCMVIRLDWRHEKKQLFAWILASVNMKLEMEGKNK